MWVQVIMGLLALVAYSYWYVTRKWGCFEAGGIKETPKYFPCGSWIYWKMYTGRAPFSTFLNDIYKQYGKTEKYVGTFSFSTPILVVNDLDCAKNILIKDFDHFVDRRSFDMDTSDRAGKIMANMMTMLTGEKWKTVRNIISPIFTSGKLKAMTPLINKVGSVFVDHLKGVAERGEEFNAKLMMTNYALDSIASCGFGVETNSFKDPDGIFPTMVKQAVGGGTNSPSRMFKVILMLALPKVAKFFKFNFIDEEPILFLNDAILRTIEQRRKDKIRRNDLIDLVVEALDNYKKKGGNQGQATEVEAEGQFEKDAAIQSSTKEAISEDEFELLMVSNALVLFFAGFDTTSTVLSVCLALLAQNPDVQETLRREVQDAISNSSKEKGQDLDYAVVQELPFLDAVLMETLRYYPLGALERLCVKPYPVPGTSFVVPKGMLVQISAPEIMQDHQFYPEPDRFDPAANFSAEAKAQRSPYAFLAFGHGPRNCIGMRFALLMAKIALVRLTANFKILPGEKLAKKIEPDAMNLQGLPKGGVWIKLKAL